MNASRRDQAKSTEDARNVKRRRKPHRKSRLGCKQCKIKRRKCDESLPVCSGCKGNSKIRCSYLDLSAEEVYSIKVAKSSRESLNEKQEISSNEPDPLPMGQSVNCVHNIYRYPIMIKKAFYESKSFDSIFDRTNYITKFKSLTYHVSELSFLNANKCLALYYTFLIVGVEVMLGKLYSKHLQEKRLLDRVDESDPDNTYDFTLDQAKKCVLLFKYKKAYLEFRLDAFKDLNTKFVNIVNAHSLTDPNSSWLQNPEVSSKMTYIDQCCSWIDLLSNLTTFHETIHTMEEDPNTNYICEARRDFFRFLEIVSKTSVPPNKNSVSIALSLSSLNESIKTGYTPVYHHSVLYELLDELKSFGSFFDDEQNIPSVFKIQFETIRKNFQLLRSFSDEVMGLAKDFSSLISPSPKSLLALLRRWSHIVPDEHAILFNNKNIPLLQKIFYLYYNAIFQIGSNLMPQLRFFMFNSSLMLDFLVLGSFGKLDFEEFKNVDDLSADELKVYNHLYNKLIYLLRVISHFRIRKFLMLRYLKLNTADVLIELDEKPFLKDFKLNNIQETQIKSFKNTIIKPEHYIHSADTTDKCDPILFEVPEQEKCTNFFAKNFEAFNHEYNAGFDEKLKSTLLSSENYTKVKDMIKNDKFDMIEFVKLNDFKGTKFSQNNYFNIKTGLLNIDFDPLRELDRRSGELKSTMQKLDFDLVPLIRRLRQELHKKYVPDDKIPGLFSYKAVDMERVVNNLHSQEQKSENSSEAGLGIGIDIPNLETERTMEAEYFEIDYFGADADSVEDTFGELSLDGFDTFKFQDAF